MSMLSAQCDKLRSMAESVGLEVPQAATLMMEAADTILELRDDLQRTNAENAKLRELARGLHKAYVGALNEAEAKDAGLIWEYCGMVDAELAKSHARFEADRHRFDVAMRELGIEASDG